MSARISRGGRSRVVELQASLVLAPSSRPWLRIRSHTSGGGEYSTRMPARCTETNERSGTHRVPGQLREMHGRTRVRVGNRVWGVRSRVPCSFRHRCLARFISPVSRCHAMSSQTPPFLPSRAQEMPANFLRAFSWFRGTNRGHHKPDSREMPAKCLPAFSWVWKER